MVSWFPSQGSNLHSLHREGRACALDYQCMCEHAQSCPTLRDPMNCSPPGSSVHGIVFQTRILERVAISYSRGSSRHRDRTSVSGVSCLGRWILNHCTTWDTYLDQPGGPQILFIYISLIASRLNHLLVGFPPLFLLGINFASSYPRLIFVGVSICFKKLKVLLCWGQPCSNISHICVWYIRTEREVSNNFRIASMLTWSFVFLNYLPL